MTDEFISKQDAINIANDWLLDCFKMQKQDRSCGLIRRLEDSPSADVAPVVHGKWMKEDRGHVEYCAVCDQCGFDWMWSDRGYFKFCPNCGAKMDGKE